MDLFVCLFAETLCQRGGTIPFLLSLSHSPGTDQLEGPWGCFSHFFPSFSPFWCVCGVLSLFFFDGGVLALVFKTLLSLLGVQTSVLSSCSGPSALAAANPAGRRMINLPQMRSRGSGAAAGPGVSGSAGAPCR